MHAEVCRSVNRSRRPGFDCIGYHRLSYEFRVVKWRRWFQRMASVVSSIAKPWPIHDGGVYVTDVDVGVLHKLAGQGLTKATQPKFTCRICRCIGLGPACQG